MAQCRKLKALDLWRAKTLTDVGLVHIADNCPGLMSLDIGRSLYLPSELPFVYGSLIMVSLHRKAILPGSHCRNSK